MNQKVSIRTYLFLLTTILLLAGCSQLPGRQTQATPTQVVTQESSGVISEGNLVPRDHQYLSFPAGGEVAELLVEKGDFIKTGQVIARLADREQAQAMISSANLELVSAQQAYDDLQRTAPLGQSQADLTLINARVALTNAERAWNHVDSEDFQDELDDAKVKLEEKTQDLQDAKDEFAKYSGVSTDNPKRKKTKRALNDAQDEYDTAKWALDTLTAEYDRAQAELSRAQESLAEAQRSYDDTLKGPDPDRLALAEARLENAKTQMQAAQAALDKLEIKSPYDGRIIDVNVIPHQLIGPDTWVALIAQNGDWYVETNDLTELEVVDITKGQGVTVTPDALPDLKLTGEVVDISDSFESRSGDILYKVKIRLNETDPRLRWGMTVEVDFDGTK